jgi:thioredoxin-like negative regulator of GroEL
MPSIDYWSAIWCQPCKTLKPKIRDLCEKEGWALIEHDLDEESETAAALGIMTVPTLFLHAKGHTTPMTGSTVSMINIRKVMAR